MNKLYVIIFLLGTGLSLQAQRFPQVHEGVENAPRKTYKSAKKKAKRQKEAKAIEDWAVVLKYFSDISESLAQFESIERSQLLSKNGYLEYMELLAKRKFWNKYESVFSQAKEQAIFSLEETRYLQILGRLREPSKESLGSRGNCMSFNAYSSLDPLVNDLELFWTIEEEIYESTTVEHCFTKGGTYEVFLGSRLTDSSLELPDTCIIVEIPEIPVFEFADQPRHGAVGEKISFKSALVVSTEEYEVIWDFGNGSFVMGSDPIYSYPVAGLYRVSQSLIPTLGSGQTRIEKETFVTIKNH